MTWEEFKLSAPDLAYEGEARFERTGLVLIATLRKNGWPRISPVEPLITGGHLYLGMMWRSRKALDLLRDSRCTVHSAVSNRDGSEGDFKVYGRAVEINDPEIRRRYCDALYEKIEWKPEDEEYHLFAIDVESAALVTLQDGAHDFKVWPAADPGAA